MLSNYLNFQFDVQGKPVNGFCLQIQDDFHETYAVIVEGYHSFCIWLDQPSSTWRSSRYTSVEPGILEKIINYLNSHKSA